MRTTYLKRTALTIIVGLAVAACSDGGTEQASHKESAVRTETALSDNPGHLTQAPSTADTVPEAVKRTGGRSALKSYECSEPLACSNRPLGASSEAEAQWLSANGYPSESELKALEALGDAQLADRSKQGSLAAMAVLGERLSKNGDSKTGLTMLMNASERGSIYAYYGLSRVYSTVQKDNLQAAAFLRVAYILGDSKAAAQMLQDFPGYGPADYSVIDRRASELYKTFARERRPVVRPAS